MPRGKRKKVDINAGDVVKGNPANLLMGRDEKPASLHRPLEPKPKVINSATIIHDIELRMDQLRPAVEEYDKLTEADEVLKGI